MHRMTSQRPWRQGARDLNVINRTIRKHHWSVQCSV